MAGPLAGTGNEQIVLCLATEAQELFELTKPFCASLQVAARWGAPDAMAPWADGIQAFVQAASKTTQGVDVLLELRHLPGMVSIMTAGLASVANRRWDNLKALVADSTIRGWNDAKPIAILEATGPYKPFDAQNLTINTLVVAARLGKPLNEVVKDVTQNRLRKFPTPVAEWLHDMLRPLFEDQLPDNDAYAAAFDRAEVVLGVLDQDAVNVRIAASPDGKGSGRSHWFGRSTWRANQYHGNPVDDLQHELATEGARWAPLLGELFGGEVARAKSALDRYSETFANIAHQRRFDF